MEVCPGRWWASVDLLEGEMLRGVCIQYNLSYSNEGSARTAGCWMRQCPCFLSCQFQMSRGIQSNFQHSRLEVLCLICILSILHWREQVIRDAAERKTGENTQRKICAGYAHSALRKYSCPTKGFFPFLCSRSFPLARGKKTKNICAVVFEIESLQGNKML